MKYNKSITVAMMCLINIEAHASIFYRCQMETKVVYQQAPCFDPLQEKVIDSQAFPKPIGTDLSIGANQLNVKLDADGNMVLPRSKDTHFYIPASINGFEFNFLIDTGATNVSLPIEIAKSARLISTGSVMTKTATGSQMVQTTSIKELKLGNQTFKSVSATIITGDQALLGINVLSHFDIIQKEDTLTLKLR